MLNVSICEGLCLHYDCWSGNEKKPETQEPVLSNTSILMRAVLGILYETYSAFMFVITQFFVEISVAIVIVLIVVNVMKYAWKGRPTNAERIQSNVQTKAQAVTPVSAATNINFCNTTKFYKESAYESEMARTLLISAMSKPEKLKQGMNIHTWLKQLDLYLKPFDEKTWVPIATTNISEECFSRIGDFDEIHGEKEYEKLKQRLITLFERNTKKNELCKVEQGDMTKIVALKQTDESLEEYGAKLIDLTTKTFPHIDIKKFDEMLKQQFIKGIADPRLKQKLSWKVSKSEKISQQPLTIKDLILYATLLKNSFDCESERNAENTSTEDERQMQICYTRQNGGYYNNNNTLHYSQQQQHKNQSYAPAQQYNSNDRPRQMNHAPYAGYNNGMQKQQQHMSQANVAPPYWRDNRNRYGGNKGRDNYYSNNQHRKDAQDTQSFQLSNGENQEKWKNTQPTIETPQQHPAHYNNRSEQTPWPYSNTTSYVPPTQQQYGQQSQEGRQATLLSAADSQ